ncbi:hypothetical protein [Lactovum odontotermitis]
MVKDKNADKRYEYNLKISSNEQKTIELLREQKQVNLELEDFEQTMNRTFSEILEIEAELNRRNGQPNAFSETEYKKRHLSQMISRHREQTTAEYQTASQALKDSRETLQKERDNLTWD